MLLCWFVPEFSLDLPQVISDGMFRQCWPSGMGPANDMALEIIGTVFGVKPGLLRRSSVLSCKVAKTSDTVPLNVHITSLAGKRPSHRSIWR